MKDKEIKRLVIIISVLLAILIVPFLLSWSKSMWNYHMNYITEDAITNYCIEYLENDSAVCLGTSSVDGHIVTWWDTGELVDNIRVLNFKKVKDKYYLYDDDDPIQNNQGIYTYYITHNCIILITTPDCKEITYMIDTTKYKVSVDSVPFVYSTTIPQELQFHIFDDSES